METTWEKAAGPAGLLGRDLGGPVSRSESKGGNVRPRRRCLLVVCRLKERDPPTPPPQATQPEAVCVLENAEINRGKEKSEGRSLSLLVPGVHSHTGPGLGQSTFSGFRLDRA